MSRWEPKACDHADCLRVAAEKVYRTNPSRFEYLCETHIPVRITFPDGSTVEAPA